MALSVVCARETQTHCTWLLQLLMRLNIQSSGQIFNQRLADGCVCHACDQKTERNLKSQPSASCDAVSNQQTGEMQ